MNIRARFQCLRVEEQLGHAGKCAERLMFFAIYSADPASPNYSWSQATPDGQLTMTISNPGAWGAFKVGHMYDLQITPADLEDRAEAALEDRAKAA